MISYGREGYKWPKNEFLLLSNTIVNDHPNGGAFVRTAEGSSRLISANNILIGRGKYHTSPDVLSMNDITSDWHIFERASRYDYRLSQAGYNLRYQDTNKINGGGADLASNQEYVHARKTRPIPAPRYPGALQSLVSEAAQAQ